MNLVSHGRRRSPSPSWMKFVRSCMQRDPRWMPPSRACLPASVLGRLSVSSLRRSRVNPRGDCPELLPSGQLSERSEVGEEEEECRNPTGPRIRQARLSHVVRPIPAKPRRTTFIVAIGVLSKPFKPLSVKRSMATKNSSFAIEAVLPWGNSATSGHKRLGSEEITNPTAEGVNWDPSFGSSLLNDNFGQRVTEDDDDFQALDPLKLEAEVGRTSRTASAEMEPGDSRSSPPDPLLGNPNGATQMFSNMHGVAGGLEDEPELEGPAKTGLRHKAGLTVGAQRVGVTDWGNGTDGGQTGKPQDGVPYGSFIGV